MVAIEDNFRLIRFKLKYLLWDVHNNYKAELVVSSSAVDGGNDNGFHGVKPLR